MANGNGGFGRGGRRAQRLRRGIWTKNTNCVRLDYDKCCRRLKESTANRCKMLRLLGVTLDELLFLYNL